MSKMTRLQADGAIGQVRCYQASGYLLLPTIIHTSQLVQYGLRVEDLKYDCIMT